MSDSSNKIIVLGLGNDILTDDAIGLHVVRELRQRLAGVEGVDVRETMEMGLALLDFIVGYRGLVLVDSIQTGKVVPGVIQEIDGTDLKQLPGPTPHFLGVGETLALGRSLGLTMPRDVRILAIEVADPLTLGEELTPAVAAAVKAAAERVVELARSFAYAAASCR